MFLVFITFSFFIILIFGRSIFSGKENIFNLAIRQRKMVYKDLIENKEDRFDEDETVSHMLDLISKKDDEIDHNK